MQNYPACRVNLSPSTKNASSAEIVCCMQMLISMTIFSMQANSVDSDQTALIWVQTVCYGDVLKEPADDIQS